MATLISFLGKKPKGYYETEYLLQGYRPFKTKFIGMGLTELLKPKKLLIIGTSGSMWDTFFEHFGNEDERLLKLIEQASNNQVSEDLLQEMTPELEKRFGCKVCCIVIEYAKNNTEQINLLHRLANELTENESILFDVTHGFRHLPMLYLVAARFLKSTKNIQTEHIYYGAFEMKQGNQTPAPVVELNGLLSMLDWVDALSAYKQSNDYAALGNLLDEDNKALLQKAAFFENINQIHNAISPLGSFRHNLENEKIDNSFMPLVAEDLSKDTQWIKESRLDKYQLRLAERNLKNGDYLQACIRIQEAWISKMVYKEKGDMKDYKKRESAKENFLKENNDDKQQFNDLSTLRNAMAHGTEPKYEKMPKNKQEIIRKILQDEAQLRKELTQILEHVKQWS